MPAIFRTIDPKVAAERLTAVADTLEKAGVQVRYEIADMGLAMIASGGSSKAEPAEVVPMAQIFNHEKDELAAAAQRLITKVRAGSAQVAA